MAEADQIPRNSLAWLLLAQLIILLPHSLHAPAWLWLGWGLVVLWRWQIFRGAWGFPSVLLRLALIVLFAGVLLLQYGAKLDINTMVVLLLAGFMLKLLELRRRRDLLLSCYLGYFVTATQLLFHQGPLAAGYALLSIWALTTTLLAAHQSLHQSHFWRSPRRAGVLLLQAIPLMLLMFLILPRFGAFWSVPSDRHTASTGVSDSMSFGDISELAQSNALAFRVTFEGAVPPPRDRYWRGLVFSQFDGRSWQRATWQQDQQWVAWSARAATRWLSDIEFRGRELSYQVMLEPTQEPWLYALSAPRGWDSELGLGPEFRLQRREPVRERLAYEVRSALDYRYQPEGLPPWQRRQELQLPAEGNPRTRARARAWRKQAGSDQALVARLLDHYRSSARYTLRPQRLGRNTVDEFLWDTQEGFCEHFAGSFVFFLRAAGVPARVVVGYLGAEANPVEDYWIVRQRDAHAWAEVWLEGRGWVRVDPTAAVAPERIERGLDWSLSEEDRTLLDRGLGSDLAFFNRIQLHWDAFNYQWHRWVLDYDEDKRKQLLEDWLGGSQIWRLALGLSLGAGLLILGLLVALLMKQRPRFRYPADRQLHRLSRKVARNELVRQPGESARAYTQRLAEVYPDSASELARIARLYELVQFAGNQSALPDLRKAVAQLRL